MCTSFFGFYVHNLCNWEINRDTITWHWFQWNILSNNKCNYIMIPNISDNSKASIFAVDGCRDRIFIWVIRFRYRHESSWWNFCIEYERKSQHVLCKTSQVSIWLETIRKNMVQLIEGIPPKQRILKQLWLSTCIH
jgi:hypothetical protein